MNNKPEFRIVLSAPDMADDLAAIQRACFPKLAEAERITAAHYRAQIARFPEGQMSIIDKSGRPVASSTDLICKMDFEHFEHRYIEAVGNNWLTTHDPTGDWLYGADIGVHPDYRGQGLSRMLYEARQNLIRRLNLKGHVAGGLLSGYGQHSSLPVKEYVDQVVAEKIFDPTLSIQLRRGFKVRGIFNNYVDDPGCQNKAALIVWDNPDYRA